MRIRVEAQDEKGSVVTASGSEVLGTVVFLRLAYICCLLVAAAVCAVEDGCRRIVSMGVPSRAELEYREDPLSVVLATRGGGMVVGGGEGGRGGREAGRTIADNGR